MSRIFGSKGKSMAGCVCVIIIKIAFILHRT